LEIAADRLTAPPNKNDDDDVVARSFLDLPIIGKPQSRYYKRDETTGCFETNCLPAEVEAQARVPLVAVRPSQ